MRLLGYRLFRDDVAFIMKRDDTSTLTLGPLDSLAGSSSRLPLIPALTVVWHPDVRRIGEMAPLTELLEHDLAPLKRDEPIFFTPGSTAGSAINHRGMSREAVVVVAATAKAFELRRGPAAIEVELDGQPFEAPRPLSGDDLGRGLILTVGRRFVLCLHGVRFPVARSPDLGLLGTGDAIEEVRRSILRVAPRDISVLIRGETGTGKELAARAVHAQSGRTGGPFVDVNMAQLRPERVAADLFGYEKGAFTGATEARPGYFRAAHGGTLFLDEIGLAAVEIQQALLRVLEDHRVHALGAAQPRSVDVRLVAATDARLEDQLADGRLIESFFHRLNSSFTISLPPLRDRREDIGLLFARLLQRALKVTGELGRLKEPGAHERPWLAARTVAQIAMAPWPGNVRALEGLAQELAIQSANNPEVDTHAIVNAFLARLPSSAPTPAQGSARAESRAPIEITKERILAALEACGWNQTRAAKVLKISRATFWRRLGTEPEIRRVLEIPLEDLLRDHQDCGGDIDVLAARLGISASVLSRRLGPRR